MAKLSPAQQKIVDVLKANPTAYVLATRYWNFQRVEFPDDNRKHWEKTIYFNRRTREVIVAKGILKEFEPNKFKLS